MTYRGVDYYAEAWPEERWPRDIQMMRDAGINLVKIGVFSWAQLEPEPGRFDFGWLERLTDRISGAGMSIMMATPTAAPPAWLTHPHPDCLNRDRLGQRRVPHGSRRHYCPTSPHYREFVTRIVDQLAEFAEGLSSIAAWQIDNEIAAVGESEPCWCPQCTAAFREWLQNRYASLDELNRAWNCVFWGSTYSSWEQIAPPYPRTSWKLDYLRFQSEQYASFVTMQATIIRKHLPGARISTNTWIGFGGGTDVTRIVAPLDFASYDCYINYHGNIQTYQASLDMYRNLKPASAPFWIAETGAWNCVTSEDDGLAALRAWVYEFLARGAEAVIYFRWRQSLMGEEEHPAILGWSGEPTVQYQQIAACFTELATLQDEFAELPAPDSDTAILWHPDCSLISHIDGSRYVDKIILADSTLNALGILPQILPVTPDLDLTGTKLVVLPQLEMVTPQLVESLKMFVANGGILLAQPQLANKDIHGKYLPKPAPVDLTDLFGIHINERFSIRGTPRYGPVQFVGDHERDRPQSGVIVQGQLFAASVMGHDLMEMPLPADGTETLAWYESGVFHGKSAVTRKSWKKGAALYQACWLDEAGTAKLFSYAAELAGINRDPNHSSCVTSIRRGRYLFCINHGKKDEPLMLPAGAEIVLSSHLADDAVLQPYGVCVAELARR